MLEHHNFQTTVFEASGVKTIIWVDDCFGPSEQKKVQVDDVIREIDAKIKSNTHADLQKSELFQDVALDSDNEFWEDDVKRKIEASDKSIDQIAFEVGAVEDYSADSIEEIKKVLGQCSTLRTFSMAEWGKESAEILKGAKDTLFLIDKDFEREGGNKDDGIPIIKEIIEKNAATKNNNYCVLFTHACRNRMEAEDSRNHWMRYYKDEMKIVELEPHSFTVLSKSGFYANDNNSPLAEKISVTLRDIFARKICATIASNIRMNILDSVYEVEEVILGQSIYELDTAIFDNSLKEGASEIELLYRIFQLAQKSAAHKSLLREQDLSSQLIKLRDISRAISQKEQENEDGEESIKAISPRLVEYRENEIWDDGQIINEVCSPLSNGDVFQLGERRFVLLGQPCDLAVRSKDGLRKPYPGILVEMFTANTDKEIDSLSGNAKTKLRKSKDIDENKAHIQVIENPKSYLNYHYLDFRSSLSVNLDVLDWCVYRNDGQVSIHKKQQVSQMVFLEGWRKRAKDLHAKLASTNNGKLPKYLAHISLSYRSIDDSDDFNMDPVWSEKDGSWNTGLTRVCRLRDPYAEHALMQYFSFRARKAFDHDFTSVG